MILSTQWYHLLFSSSSLASKPLDSRQSFKNAGVFSRSWCELKCVNPKQELQLLCDSSLKTCSIWLEPPADNTLLCKESHRHLRVNKWPNICNWWQQVKVLHMMGRRKVGQTLRIWNPMPRANSIHESLSSHPWIPSLVYLLVASWTFLSLPSWPKDSSSKGFRRKYFYNEVHYKVSRTWVDFIGPGIGVFIHMKVWAHKDTPGWGHLERRVIGNRCMLSLH